MNRKGSIPDTEECIFSFKHDKNRAVYYSVEGLQLYLESIWFESQSNIGCHEDFLGFP
jgi:hypothetical protein